MVFDPAKISYDDLLKTFWETHDPTQGMRQGNDIGSQYRSILLTTSDEQAEKAENSRPGLPAGADGQGLRRDHHLDRAARRVLLRRGLPPAVPLQGSERLLPDPRDGREVRRRLTGRGAPASRGRGSPHPAENGTVTPEAGDLHRAKGIARGALADAGGVAGVAPPNPG